MKHSSAASTMQRTRAMLLAVSALLCLPFVLQPQRISGTLAPATPPALGSIRGEIFDSLAMRPFARALVFVPGTELSTLTDDNGRFTLNGVAIGTHFVAFSSAAFDSIGLSSMGSTVLVARGENVHVTLTTPSFRTVWKSLCSWSDRLGSDSGIVWGTLRSAEGDIRLSGAAAAFNWYDLRAGTDKRVSFSQVSKTVRTDSTGTYYACGVPTDIIITTEAAGARSASGAVEYAVGERRVRRLDLLVSTDMVRSADSASSAATTITSMRARGESTVRGVVHDANGKPLANAMVTLATTDSSVRTNASGEFVMTGLPSGTHMLQARQVGFNPARVTVDLHGGQTTETSIEMPSSKTLATVNVRAEFEPGKDRLAFEDRKRAGFGYGMLLKDMENRADLTSVLREMPSVSVTSSKGLMSVTLLGRLGGQCNANIFLDGVKAVPEQIAAYRPEDFKAVEVFPRQFSVPAAYTTSNGCGAVLLWTKNSKW